MKQFNHYLLLIAVLATTLLGACRKDSISTDDTTITPNPSIQVATGVRGLVFDEAGNPLADATVYLGNTQAQTDAYGYFGISGLAPKEQAFVRVEKDGYFPSMASFSLKAGDVGRVKVTLRTKVLSAQFAASAGGTVSVPGNGSVQFQAGGFTYANGAAYTGTVNVYATVLDPSNAITNAMIPASFLGKSAAGEDQILTSYGMMHVLLESSDGQKLQINKPAQISIPVPADRLATAPATIPLWYIDESTSLWKEEGSATLQGSVYKGQVSHFSWWNCDIGNGFIRLSGTVRVSTQYPFLTLRVTQYNGMSAITTPNESGYFSGGIPANQVVLFEILNECGDVIYTQNVGPYAVDTDLGIISLNYSGNWTQIQGVLLDCDNAPVSDGMILGSVDGGQAFPIIPDPATGAFIGLLPNCGGTTASLIGIDFTTLKSSDPIEMPMDTSINFGNVVACDVQFIGGINFEFSNGNTHAIANVSVELVNQPQLQYYKFTAIDYDGPNNFAKYEISVLDWNQGLPPALYATSTVFTINGNPPAHYLIDTSPGNCVVTPLAQGTQAGEAVQFLITNCTLTDQLTQIEYPNCTVTLAGILQ